MTKTKLLFIAMALALVTWVGASAASAQNGPSILISPSSVAEAGEVEVTVTGSGFTVSSVNVLACNIDEGANAAEIDPEEYCTLTSGKLDLANMVPATVTDGGFEATITVNVPAQGIFIGAGDSGQTESAQALLSVGMGDDDMGDDDMGDDDMGDDDMGDDDMGDDDMGDDDMGDDDMGDDDMGDDDMGDDDMGDDDMGDDDMGDDDMGDDDMGDDDMGDDDMGDDDMGDDDMGDDDMLPDTGVNTPLLAIVALAVVLAGAMVLGLSRRLRIQ